MLKGSGRSGNSLRALHLLIITRGASATGCIYEKNIIAYYGAIDKDRICQPQDASLLSEICFVTHGEHVAAYTPPPLSQTVETDQYIKVHTTG